MNLLYLSSPGGGLDTNVRVLGSALANAGHQVSVLYIHLPGASAPPIDGIAGCQVYHATIGNWHYYAQRATLGLTNLPRIVREFENALTLARVVSAINQREGLDLIELSEVFATPGLMGGVPYVIRLHSAAWTWRKMEQVPSSLSDSLEMRLEGYALRRASSISSPCAMLASYIRTTCRLGSRPIEIIPYPVDTRRFAPSAENSRLPLVLFVGRVEKRKGADVLMQAMPRVWEKYPECEFVFAGRVCDDCKADAAAMPPRTKFLGMQPHGELIAWYQRAAIFAAPALWDNSPNTIYEAMACGTSVIASRVGGIPELVDEGVTGLLVPPSSPGELAEAIITLLGNDQKRERMGRRAREKVVEQYSLPRIMGRTLDFYGSVLHRRTSDVA
jgi:glycosyltransferase involved in cell wall biosynthesis